VIRDRIVTAIEANGFAGAAPRGWSEALADALIAELGLRIEKGQRSKPHGPLWGGNNRYSVHRYVTDWEADDE
jgi:hypothetical protein